MLKVPALRRGLAYSAPEGRCSGRGRDEGEGIGGEGRALGGHPENICCKQKNISVKTCLLKKMFTVKKC